MMAENTYEAMLTSPMHWETRDAEFRTKAIDMALWDYIDPKQEGDDLLTRPTKPQFRDFPMATTTTVTPADSVTVDGSQGPLRATTYMELSSENQKSFQFLMNTYNHEMNRYEAQRGHIKDLRSWVLKTVDPQYRKTSCIPTDSLRDWYKKLQAQVKMDDMRVESMALDKYAKATIPLTSPPRDFFSWLKNWTTAMAELQSKSIPHASHPKYWLRSFMAAVRPVKENWATTYQAIYKPAVLDGSLDYRTVANDFRDELLSDQANRKGRAQKGAFLATQQNQGAAKHTRDDNKPATGPAKKQKTEDTKELKDSNKEHNSVRCTRCRRPRCKEETCYYAHPEQAFDGWEPNPRIKALAERNLSKQRQSKSQEPKDETRARSSPQTQRSKTKEVNDD